MLVLIKNVRILEFWVCISDCETTSASAKPNRQMSATASTSALPATVITLKNDWTPGPA